MKVWRHISKRFAWIMVITLGIAPIGTHAAAGVLICIEADGPGSIELAQGLKCSSDILAEKIAEENDDHSTEHLFEEESLVHCVDCIDIVLKGASDGDCASFIKAPQTDVRQAPAIELGEQFVDQEPRMHSCTHEAGLHEGSTGIISHLTTVILLT